jgi:serine/threonine protein kinase
MDPHPVSHPTDRTLNSYGLGKLDGGSAAAVNRHLERCPDCRKRVAEMSADSFLGRIRDVQKSESHPMLSQSQPGGTRRAQGTNAPAQTLPPGLADHPDYQIKRELGRGGMGVVYLAHNRLMGRDEVLKVMGRHVMERPRVLDRFLREIRVVAELRHPNIVTAYHAFRLGESIVFAMEYVAGLDLSRMVKAKGPLPVGHACNFVYQAALGLQHAHEVGFVHRDIKPGNLMLSHSKDKAVIKILDFGLAKTTREEKGDSGLTSEGQALGTPDFIAPEQILDAPSADIRADIYSLGGTLHYLLAGLPPFQAPSLYDIYQAHISRDANPLNLVRPEVPAELAALVAKMMAKDPARRFQTPGEVAQALVPFFKKGTAAFEGPRAEVSQAGQSTAGQREGKAVSTAAQPATDAGRPMVGAKTAAEPTVPEAQWESLIGFREADRSNEATPSSAPSRQPPWVCLSVAIAVLLFGFVVTGALVLRVKTAYGLIKLVNLPADAEVFVDGAEVAVTWPGGGKPAVVTVTAGKHKIKVEKDGLGVSGEEVTVQAGGKQEFLVRFGPLPDMHPGQDGPPVESAEMPTAPLTPSPRAASAAPPRSESNKDPAPSDSVPGDRDRRAAQAVLLLGGSVTVRVNGRNRPIEPGKALPPEAFQLTHVHLGDQPELTDAGLQPLEGLTNLIELSLSKARKVTGAGVAHLRNLPGLKHLWLDGTSVTDAGLGSLSRLAQLKSLWLDGTRVTDAGLEHLRSLTQLKELNLSRTQVTDAGLVRLHDLKHLEKLHMNGTRVTDSGLVHLKVLTQLKELHIHDTRVTAAGVEGLKESLPACRFMADPAQLEKVPGAIDSRRTGKSQAPPTATIDLLSMIDIRRDTTRGRWQRIKSSLVSVPGQYDVIQLPYRPPDEYKMEITAERIKEGDDLQIGVVRGQTECVVVLDGWGGQVSGISWVDGQFGNGNETTYRGRVFTDTGPTHLVITVRRQHIQVAADGRSIIDWRGNENRLSMRERIRQRELGTERGALFLAVYDGGASYRIGEVKLTPLSGTRSEKVPGIRKGSRSH